LENDPYRTTSKSYVIVGFLAEHRLRSNMRVFLNAATITDARQTRWSPLVRPNRATDGRWTTDVWGPLEGRSFNGGVRVSF
jgi:outer membrane receptor for ferrienterochelin and colicins